VTGFAIAILIAILTTLGAIWVIDRMQPHDDDFWDEDER
jgi:hypothetical protein